MGLIPAMWFETLMVGDVPITRCSLLAELLILAPFLAPSLPHVYLRWKLQIAPCSESINLYQRLSSMVKWMKIGQVWIWLCQRHHPIFQFLGFLRFLRDFLSSAPDRLEACAESLVRQAEVRSDLFWGPGRVGNWPGFGWKATRFPAENHPTWIGVRLWAQVASIHHWIEGWKDNLEQNMTLTLRICDCFRLCSF
jgi:hypothetical protein